MRWLTNHRYITEDPHGSNRDKRLDGITAAQRACANGGNFLVGQPWCGVWHFMALRAGKVKGISSRQASVALIEEDAKKAREPYRRGWTKDPRLALRGDAVILFGYGHHVETVRSTAWTYRKLGYIRTEGGNTSSSAGGHQSNGGGAYPRWRRLRDVRGFALADFPNE